MASRFPSPVALLAAAALLVPGPVLPARGATGLRGPNAVAGLRGPNAVAAGLVVQGRGFGHGVGMPQDGAHALALAGADAYTILSTFYPGTSVGSRSGTVRAELLEHPADSLVVSLPSGGEVTASGAGFPIAVSPGGSVRLTFDGTYHAFPLGGATAAAIEPAPPPPSPGGGAAPGGQAAPATTTTVPSLLGLIPLPPPPASTTTAPPPPTTAPPPAPEPTEPSEPTSSGAVRAVPAEDGSVVLPELGRRYRGVVEATAAAGGLQLINEIDVEEYLRGMGEADPGWPAAALQAQAIAARTYALDAMANGRPLCSSQLCQVYLGETAEYGAMNGAVATTAGEVLTYGGELAEAVYSANAGGITATPEEGFGRDFGDYPYLQPVPYTSATPDSWEVEITWGELATRIGYPGVPSSAQVSRTGPSGRALEVNIDGDAGPLAVEGVRFADQLGLRSTLFSLRAVEDVAATPVPRSATGSARARRPALVLQAGSGGRPPLGRAPWAAVAALLVVACSATLAFRVGAGRGKG